MQTVLFYAVLVVGGFAAIVALGSKDTDERLKSWLAALTCLVACFLLVMMG